MINFKSVTLRRGQRLLFENASFTVHRGERVGITGANGAGKSSLFELVLGTLQPEGGEVAMPPGLAIAHVAQETPAVLESALDYVMDGDHELRRIQRTLARAEATGDGVDLAHLHTRLEAAGGYEAPARAARLLAGLGFAPGDKHRAVAEFSGGWRMRLNVAQALMCRSDILLLDEPTNHLDLDAVLWLQDWLASYCGTLLLVSHDRDFLDDLTDHILHIENRAVTLYAGNYSAFENRRAELLSQQQSSYERQQREITRISGFVNRFRAKATKARQAQSRLKALERMQLVARAQVDSSFEFSFRRLDKLPSPLLRLDDVAAGYDGTTIFSGAKLTLNPGDRIGLLGPNGAGKSTLVKLMAGVLAPLAGERLAVQALRIGYFAQHQLEQLRQEESALQHLQRLDPRATERDLRGFLGGFGFRGDQTLEPIAPFSGGEKSRLALVLLIYRKPNLLLLDEPTNHLDLAARDALCLALQDYQGALVVVSHDRYLLRTITDDYWLVADGVLKEFTGDLEEYRRWLVERRTLRAPDDSVPASLSRKEQRRVGADRRRLLRPLQQVQQDAEAALERWTAAKKGLERRLADADLYRADARTRLQELLMEQAGVEKSLAEAETAWLEASEALEAALGSDRPVPEIRTEGPQCP